MLNDICQELCASVSMEMNIVKMFEWDAWANAKVMAALHPLHDGEDVNRAWSILAHQVNAQLLWLTRMGLLKEGVAAANIWPEADKQNLRKMMELAAQEWVSATRKTKPEQIFGYTNSQNMRFEGNFCEITTHVLFHGQYHRGQINQLSRGAGGEPARIDYIFYLRE